MGTAWCIGSPEREEYVALWCKDGEMSNELPSLLLVNFLQMCPRGEEFSLRWFNDVSPIDEELVVGWRDVTADVFVHAFGGGWEPKQFVFGEVYGVFQRAGRLGELSDWLKRWGEE